MYETSLSKIDKAELGSIDTWTENEPVHASIAGAKCCHGRLRWDLVCFYEHWPVLRKFEHVFLLIKT